MTASSHSLASRVNQRLACARALLLQLQQEQAPLTRVALQDGCLFHLYAGLFHYLREVCQYQGIKNLQAIDSIDSARHALSREGKVSAELDELWQLGITTDSWLADLESAYNVLWALPAPVTKIDTPQQGYIALVNLDREARVVTPERLGECLEQLRLLIERHRESSTEY